MSSKIEIKIAGLRQHTAAHLEKSIESVPGVQSVEIDHQRECAIVEHDGADPKELEAAVAAGGYQGKVNG